jgi:hypothetical protein
VAPDVLGREEYVARHVLVVRALAERFDGDGYLDAPGSPVVAVWQIENELNEALATAIGGSRWPGGLDVGGSAWSDFAYVEQLFYALTGAVEQQAPHARRLVNFHTSVHPNIDATLGVPTWQDAVVRWRDHLDWIGLDSYPNYLRAAPLGATEVGDTVAAAVRLAGGRPVCVIETSYGSGPAILGYDEERQATFVTELDAAVRDNGAAGLFWFGTRTSESHGVDISARDVAILTSLSTAYAAGDVQSVFSIMGADLTYFTNHVSRVIDASGGYIGLMRADGSHKPAWDRLAAQTTMFAPDR